MRAGRGLNRRIPPVVLAALVLAALALAALVVAASGCGGGAGQGRSVRSTVSTVSTASTASTAAPSGRAAPPGRAAAFGADVDELFLGRTLDAGTVDRQLAAAAADGLGLARAAPLWEFTEPRPPRGGRHHYDWRFADFIAGRLAAHGFHWVALLAYAPGWASRTPTQLHGAPITPAGYAAYAEALARRYRGRIAAYEIWNEENSSTFWRPAPDPAAYAQLYLAARAAIHRVDPGTPVLIGGLANSGSAFLAQLLQRPELRGQIDGLAVHPYGRDPAQVLDRVRGYRLQMRALGAGQVPLYVTEYGWATHPASSLTYAAAAQRGPFISTVAQDLLRSDCQVRMVIFYAWTTAERDPASVDQWYGLAAPDGGQSSAAGAQTPATAAVASAVGSLAAPATPLVRLCGA